MHYMEESKENTKAELDRIYKDIGYMTSLGWTPWSEVDLTKNDRGQ